MPAIGQYRIIRDQIWINGSTDKVNQLDLAAMGMTACALQQKQNKIYLWFGGGRRLLACENGRPPPPRDFSMSLDNATNVCSLDGAQVNRQPNFAGNAATLRRSGDGMSTHAEAKSVVLLVALYLLTVFVPRLLVFPVSNIDWDEYYSALIAEGLLRGQLPYDYVSSGHHPAASYYFYAPFLAVFGSNVIAIRAIALTYTSAGFYLIYRICTEAGLEARQSSICAALYGIITLPSWGLASNTELILNPLILSVTLASLSYSRGPTRTGAATIGALSGVCVSVNYIAAPIVGSLGLCAIILVRRDLKAAVIEAGIAAVSALSIFGILLLPVILFGHIVTYFGDQIAFLREYAALAIQGGPKSREVQLFVGYCISLILVPGIAAATILWVKRAQAPLSGRGRLIFVYLCCYVASALLAAVAPRRFYPHYTLLTAPAIALMAGAVLHLCRGRYTLRYALVATAAIAVAQPVLVGETRWTFESGLEGWAHWFNHKPSDSLAEIAQEVRLHTHRGDYIFATYTHDLYILSDTRSPTRFAFGGDQWISDRATMRVFGTTPVDELDRILALHPKLIVVEEGAALRHVDPEYLRRLAAALAGQYEYLKTIDRVELYRLKPVSAVRLLPLDSRDS
jgi:hypothetical protein